MKFKITMNKIVTSICEVEIDAESIGHAQAIAKMGADCLRNGMYLSNGMRPLIWSEKSMGVSVSAVAEIKSE